MTLHAKPSALTPKLRRPRPRCWWINWIVQGVSHAFCIPGESYLPLLDALRDSDIQVIACRNEGGAAMMAEAFGKATGRPGICFVTRGPGATNASAGIHIAQQESTPMILFVGQVERKHKGRDAFQELDYPAVFGSMTKWAAEIAESARMTEYVGRAFSTAMAGRPWPVVLALPRDMLAAPADCIDAPRCETLETQPRVKDIAALEDLLASAEQPMLILGGSRWSERARAQVTRFAERFALPVATGYRRAPLFDQTLPNYAGDLGLNPNPRLVARIKASDLVIVAGARLNQTTSQGYTLFEYAADVLVHAYPHAEEIGRVFAPRLAIHASPQRFAAVLDTLTPRHAPGLGRCRPKPPMRNIAPFPDAPLPQPGAVNLSQIMIWLRKIFPPMPFSAMARAVLPPGFTASTASAVLPPISRLCRNPWAMACLPPWR